jgi:hypothetical protein
MPKDIHVTVSGFSIDYDATPKVRAFLKRLEALISDPQTTEQEMIGLAYSQENPILDHTLHPTRGMVTAEVLKNPVRKVVQDMLFRKDIVFNNLDVEKIAARFSMTVGEAAASIGVTEGAIRQAIGAERLAAWNKQGRHYVDPRFVKALEIGTRAPVGAKKPTAVVPLEVRMGSASGASLSVKSKHPILIDEQIGKASHGQITSWTRVLVRTTGEGGSKRAWVLVPGPEDNQIAHDEFFVRGRFTIAETTNNPKKADEIWKGTQPE